MRELTPEILIELGYERSTWEDDDGDEVVNWDNGILKLFEDNGDNTSYSFAQRTREDGSFKSGWSIKTDEQLLLLEKALTGKIK